MEGAHPERPVKALLREARYADSEAVDALTRRNGLQLGWAEDRWTGVWRENPAMLEDGSIPIGWVLEHGGCVVGYLGNIPMHYWFRGKRRLAVAARGLVVDPAWRGQSLQLISAFFSQENIDLLLNTSANEVAGAVFEFFRAEKIPSPDYDQALFWITGANGFAVSAMRRRGHGRGMSLLGGAVLAPLFRLDGILRRRGPRAISAGCEIVVLEPHAIGAEFDEFWQRMLAERGQCLLAERSAQALRWHFDHSAAAARRAKFICVRREGRMEGYAVLVREDSERLGLERSRIADLIAGNDEPAVIDALLQVCCREARKDGSHMLEMIGFPEKVRARFLAGRPYMWRLPSWPFWYKAVAADLCDGLKYEDAWYGSPYDGDASL